MDIESILKTEYYPDFDELRKKQMATSFFKYGHVKDNVPAGLTQTIPSLEKRLAAYKRTGNLEFLADIANMAMIEWKYPQHPNAHFNATDSAESPGLVGMSINEIKEFR